MSVKFQETVQTQVTDTANNVLPNAIPRVSDKIRELKGDIKNEDLSHRLGEYLTGGDTGKGYLAVHLTCLFGATMTANIVPGLSETTPDQSSPNQDAHIRWSRRPARTHCFVARP